MKRFTFPSLALLVALPVLVMPLTGCASGGVVPGSARSAAQAETVAELSRRVLDLQKQVTVHEVEIERLRRQLARLGSSPATSSPAPSAAPPPRQPAVDRPANPAPPPQLDEEDLDLQGFGQPVRRPGEPPQPSTGSTAPLPEAAAPPPSDAATILPASDEQEIYDVGYTDYHQGRFVDAEAAFQRFLGEFPESSLADNAQYWIGESRYARRDFEGALRAFGETVRRYPGGNKVPDALLKAGQSLEELGDVEGARETYRELTNRYPATAASATAQERLQVLP